MMKTLLLFIGLPLCFCLSAQNKTIPLIESAVPNDITAKELINKIFIATDNIKTLKFTFICKERVNGQLTFTKSNVKLQTAPKKLYLNCKEAEILWLENQNNNQALVHPYGFPYFNLNLDPDNSFLRSGQHHSIRQVGFEYLINIMKAGSKEENTKRICLYNGEETINDRLCFKMTVLNPDFAFVDYTVKKNETMISIALKLNVSEYMILENNRRFSAYSDVRENDVIKVPNTYAKTTVLYVDKQLQLPVVIRVYDDKGLFENFEYNSIQINPYIGDDEFTKKYKEYGF